MGASHGHLARPPPAHGGHTMTTHTLVVRPFVDDRTDAVYQTDGR